MKVNEYNTLTCIACLTFLHEASHLNYDHAIIIVEALKQMQIMNPTLWLSMDSGVVFILGLAPLKDEYLP